MQSVDATCTVCGRAIRWAAGAEPRKCDEHRTTSTALEQAKAIVKDLGEKGKGL